MNEYAQSTTPCCYLCGRRDEIRPYGPNASWICFDCMIASPEREADAKRQFGAQLDACGDVAVIDGSSAGPYPLDGGRNG